MPHSNPLYDQWRLLIGFTFIRGDIYPKSNPIIYRDLLKDRFQGKEEILRAYDVADSRIKKIHLNSLYSCLLLALV